MTYCLPNGNQVRMMLVDGEITLVEFLSTGERMLFVEPSGKKEYQAEIQSKVKSAYYMPGEEA